MTFDKYIVADSSVGMIQDWNGMNSMSIDLVLAGDLVRLSDADQESKANKIIYNMLK